MRYLYPATLEQDEDGRYVARAVDVPEAVTDGATWDEALREMSEALGAALAGYAVEGRAIPEPSAAAAGARLVPVSPLVAAKLALRAAMREAGISNSALAQRLGISEGAVRRLVDPDHASRLDGIVAALHALGHSLIIEDQSNAAQADVPLVEAAIGEGARLLQGQVFLQEASPLADLVLVEVAIGERARLLQGAGFLQEASPLADLALIGVAIGERARLLHTRKLKRGPH